MLSYGKGILGVKHYRWNLYKRKDPLSVHSEKFKRGIGGLLINRKNPIKAKDPPWYAALSNLSVAGTVDAKVKPFLNFVNIFKVKFLILLIFNDLKRFKTTNCSSTVCSDCLDIYL
jgi:hypothetical protein